ncbi:hypothetical protein L484_011189 [Morus notabilis]|uniref:Uncharacterized protein n=1 Tax=Morus notabilis TaxID=981085 RepID=W9SAL8_9ROSA|nr:hypothetical protein L484_011189 [Morus notabilis]
MERQPCGLLYRNVVMQHAKYDDCSLGLSRYVAQPSRPTRLMLTTIFVLGPYKGPRPMILSRDEIVLDSWIQATLRELA